jgi:hypothetical protein
MHMRLKNNLPTSQTKGALLRVMNEIIRVELHCELTPEEI